MSNTRTCIRLHGILVSWIVYSIATCFFLIRQSGFILNLELLGLFQTFPRKLTNMQSLVNFGGGGWGSQLCGEEGNIVPHHVILLKTFAMSTSFISIFSVI